MSKHGIFASDWSDILPLSASNSESVRAEWGEVYRATDIKLNRDVALKVLPELFARNAERMVRFRREAQVLASLNHPNIATIYGLEESNGNCALVMELVEGPTLAGRIAQGPIPLDEVLPIAKQIADGLEYGDLLDRDVELVPVERHALNEVHRENEVVGNLFGDDDATAGTVA